MLVKQIAVGSLLCGVLSAFAVSAVSAHADNINLSGAACRNYNAGEAQNVDRLMFGVRNLNASSRQVIHIPREVWFYSDFIAESGVTAPIGVLLTSAVIYRPRMSGTGFGR